MACTSHFHLLTLLLFIHGAQTCPPSIDFDCSDHAYIGKYLKYPFTNVSLPKCGHCILKCDKNVTMIACGVYPKPKGKFLEVLNISIAHQTMVLRSPRDDKWRNNPCRAHKLFGLSSSPWVSLIMGFKTFIKCHIHPQGSFSPAQSFNYTNNCRVQDNNTVNGPYGDYHPPPNIPIPTGCEAVEFPSIPPNTNNFTVRYEFSSQCQQCVEAGGRCSDDGPEFCYWPYNINNGKKLHSCIDFLLPQH